MKSTEESHHRKFQIRDQTKNSGKALLGFVLLLREGKQATATFAGFLRRRQLAPYVAREQGCAQESGWRAHLAGLPSPWEAPCTGRMPARCFRSAFGLFVSRR